MTDLFGVEFFQGNRQRLRTLFSGTAPIVVTAHGLLQRNSDVGYPFRQDSSFWYLTGIDDAGVILVLDKSKEYLILPDQSDYQHSFDGSLSAERLSKSSGIDTVLNQKDGWKELGTRLKRVKHVATLAPSPAYIEMYGLYTNPARRHLIRRLKQINPQLELLDLKQHLNHMRMIKQPPEIMAVQAAIDLTIGALKRVSTKLPRLKFDYEVEAVITEYFLRHNADNAWKPMVAPGAKAAVLHAQASSTPLVNGELLVIDIGAEVEHYAADITRTLAINKSMTRRQKAVYNAVLEVQIFAISQLKPGILVKETEQKVVQFMGEKLRELGLIKIINRENVRHYFPHAASHFLGLDPHDAGDYEQPLSPNVVITVEPGIYIPEEGIGVRIEDDVLITPEGAKVLSAKLPK